MMDFQQLMSLNVGLPIYGDNLENLNSALVGRLFIESPSDEQDFEELADITFGGESSSAGAKVRSGQIKSG